MKLILFTLGIKENILSDSYDSSCRGNYTNKIISKLAIADM